MARSGAKVAWVLLVSLSGCGYRFVARGSELPEGVKSVCAPIFSNETPEPALEALFTEAFRQELVRAGNLAKGACEARVEGAIVGVGSAPTIIEGNYRASVTVRLRLVKEGRLLRETYVSGSEDYVSRLNGVVNGDVLDLEANRQAALHRLVETLMREGYERLASG